MSKYILVLYISINACSIKAQKVSTFPPCLLEFKKEVATHWRYDSLKKCYLAAEDWVQKLEGYEKCLKGCDTSLLISIFGRQNYKTLHFKPLTNYRYSTAIEYKSDGSKAEGWILLHIVCDSTGKFVRFSGADFLKPQGSHEY